MGAVCLSRTRDPPALGLGDFMNISIWFLGFPLSSPCPFQLIASLPCHSPTGITPFPCPWRQHPLTSLS